MVLGCAIAEQTRSSRSEGTRANRLDEGVINMGNISVYHIINEKSNFRFDMELAKNKFM